MAKTSVPVHRRPDFVLDWVRDMARPVTCPAKTEPESMNPGVPMGERLHGVFQSAEAFFRIGSPSRMLCF